MHGEETAAFGDAGYQGIDKREAARGPNWHVAMRAGLRRKLDPSRPWQAMLEQAEQIKASIRAKVEHVIGVIKRIFGFTKVRYRGLAKNLHRLEVTAALANVYMVRRRLLRT